MGGCGHHRFDRFFELIGAADRVLDIASFLTEQRTGDLEAAFGDGPGHRDRIADLTRTIRGFTYGLVAETA